MSVREVNRRDDPFKVLRRFARPRSTVERCEFCAREVGAEHQHLLEAATRRLLCVCDACAVLFPGSQLKYQRVPRTVRRLDDFRITDAQWDGLLIPIGMAFFYESVQAGRVVAVYPSPAGPTESLLPLETWQDIARANPVVAAMERDVEALVANRLAAGRGGSQIGDGRAEYYILPIDECFKMVGLIRLHWKGLSGGTEVWRELAGFFDRLRARAIRSPEVARA
jgi:hypothetical protein